jgi:hypothetical protein
MNKTINFCIVFTPFPTFPHGGRSISGGISPLGETGKGVILNNIEVFGYQYYKTITIVF